jgi:uncharacterized membrane protein
MVIEKKNKKYNKSAVFLLPMLDIKLNLFANFYNVYYKTIYNKDENEKRIYLVYELNAINEKVISNITNCEYYINSYNIDDFKIFIYRVPVLYNYDFMLFCNGKYNSFSKLYKDLLLKSYGMLKGEELNRILNSKLKHKEELAKKFDVNVKDIKEIFPIPDEIEETFSVSNNYNLEI